VTGEFEDSALLIVFGQSGTGLFAIPEVTAKDVRRHYGASIVGRLASVREQFYAISLERKVKNPAVMAITTAAHKTLFS
jgi:LysR family transcriptional activator of nhaA